MILKGFIFLIKVTSHCLDFSFFFLFKDFVTDRLFKESGPSSSLEEKLPSDFYLTTVV